MIRSLRQFDPGCRISVLCLTPACERVLARLNEPGVTLTRLADFERDNPDVLAVKASRCMRDYYFTLSGCVVASTLREAAPGEVVTYVDADLMFYANPAPIFDAIGDASVGLIGHRFHWWAKRLEKYGRFNVGWVSFRSDDTGRAAAQWWRGKCIEWCHGHPDGDRFADQKYLEHIYSTFPKVIEITHVGTNVGPWNICRYPITRGPGNTFVVGAGSPLIFFHFSGLKETAPDVFLGSHISYLGPFSRTVRTDIYIPYVALLKKIRAEIGGIPAEPSPVQAEEASFGPPSLWRRLIAPAFRLAARWAGHYIDDSRSTSTRF